MQDTSVQTTRLTNQLDGLGEARDRTDAGHIYAMFKALQPVPANSVRTRALRETIQKLWQEPRMARKPGLIYSHNKPLDFPWSPKARDLYFRRLADPSFSLAHRLDLEHVRPLGLTVLELLEKVTDPGFTAEETLSWLRERHKGLSFAVLTSTEHSGMGQLKAADVDTSLDAFARYRQACGLAAEDLISVIEDPRWPARD